MEDVRLDLAPVVLAGVTQDAQLLLIEMDTSWVLKQRTVDVSSRRVEPAGGARTIAVEPLEQLAQVIGARALRIGNEFVDDVREQVGLELAEILGEHAPNALEREVAQLIGWRRPTLPQGSEEVRHEPNGILRNGGFRNDRNRVRAPNGILRNGGLRTDEHRLVAREEHQRVETLR